MMKLFARFNGDENVSGGGAVAEGSGEPWQDGLETTGEPLQAYSVEGGGEVSEVQVRIRSTIGDTPSERKAVFMLMRGPEAITVPAPEAGANARKMLADVELPEEVRDEFIQKVNAGKINEGKKRVVIERFATPVEKHKRAGRDGIREVTAKINEDSGKMTLAEQNDILNFMIDERMPFELVSEIDPAKVAKAYERYPSVVDYEDMIARIGDKYREAANDLAVKIYGKQKDYHDAIRSAYLKALAYSEYE